MRLWPRGWLRVCAPLRREFRRRSKRLGIEGVPEPVLRNSSQLRFIEAELPRRQTILAHQRTAEHRGIVGIENDRHSGLEEPPYRMILQPLDHTGNQIAGNRDLEWNLPLAQMLHQAWILNRRNTMSNPLRSQFQRRPDRLRSRAFARMRRQAQPGVLSEPVHVRKPRCRTSLLAAADPQRHYSAANPLRGPSRYLHCLLHAELPHCVENPPHLHRRTRRGSVHRVEDGRELLALPQDDSGC